MESEENLEPLLPVTRVRRALTLSAASILAIVGAGIVYLHPSSGLGSAPPAATPASATRPAS